MVGEELGNYRVIAPLGKGGMASVYVGEHKVLGHKVAIKILHPKHLANESIERRFFNEAKAIASIKHPSVVELFDFGRADDGRAYIVMELLEGESLRARIRSGIMDQKASATFARQIASGLAKAHERGIIHRDLKPDNVFLVRDPEVALGERAKVLDFGIAKQTDFGGPVSEHTATGILVGTPAYMSPEQCRGTGTIDARSDIYSLGVVLYRMVTNQLPFEAAGTGELIGKHLYVDPKSASELNPMISPEMDQVIDRCLAKDPADRFQSMGEVADALAAARKSIADADRATPSPLPSALAAKPAQSFASPASNPPAGPSTGPMPVVSPGAVPSEDLATEIQVTPSPMHLSSEVIPKPPMTSGAGLPVPEDETSPTTLRHATGEASAVDYTIPNPNRRVAMIAVASIAIVAAIAFAVTGGDEPTASSANDDVGAVDTADDGENNDGAQLETAQADDDENAASEAVGDEDDQAAAAAKARAEEEVAEKARAEAEAKAKADAEAKAEAEAKAKAKKEAEVKAKLEEQEKARKKAEAERLAANREAERGKRLAEQRKAEEARKERDRERERKREDERKRAKDERKRAKKDPKKGKKDRKKGKKDPKGKKGNESKSKTRVKPVF